jgi:hypothetical protein
MNADLGQLLTSRQTNGQTGSHATETEPRGVVDAIVSLIASGRGPLGSASVFVRGANNDSGTADLY